MKKTMKKLMVLIMTMMMGMSLVACGGADKQPAIDAFKLYPNTCEQFYRHFSHYCFCGPSFLIAIKITSKLSNFILHQFGGFPPYSALCCPILQRYALSIRAHPYDA
jgi:hypothetical protein